MEPIKKIDIHAHATGFPQFAPAHPGSGYRMVCAEEVIGFYDKLNIEKGLLLPLISPEAQWLQIGVEETKTVADSHPDRFVWFCNVDPRAAQNSPEADLSYLLEHYKRLGARGVGELTSNIYADDPKMDNLFTHCEKQKMPVTIHIAPEPSGYYGIVDDPGLPRLEKMLKKHPDLVILGHSQSAVLDDLLHEDAPYRKSHVGTSSQRKRLEVHLRILRSDPHTGSERRRVADEPSV